MQRFSDVIVLVEGKKVPFAISLFKRGKRKIRKDEYLNYLYSKAYNFGLFYVGYCKRSTLGWSIDFSTSLGMLRFIKKLIC